MLNNINNLTKLAEQSAIPVAEKLQRIKVDQNFL